MARFFLLVLVSVFLCSGCSVGKKALPKLRPARMGGPPKDAPPLYLSGWEDGCETGLSTMVQGYYKDTYQYRQNSRLARKPMYYKAWKDAYTYCRQYSFRFLWDAIDRGAVAKHSHKPLCVLCPTDYQRR